MSAKCGEIIKTAAIERTSGRRMHFLVWQFVLTFDYHLFSMHLVHHQFGLLWPHTEHELVRRKCLFEFGKFNFFIPTSTQCLSTRHIKSFSQLFARNCIRSNIFKTMKFVESYFNKLICIVILLLFSCLWFKMLLCRIKFIRISFG